VTHGGWDMTNAAGIDLMNRIYRHQRYIYNATRKYYLLGRDRLIADMGAHDGARVLEIGCGTGRNLILTARTYPSALCFGIDLSTEMLATANRAIARAGLSSRVRVAQGDATRFDPAALFGTDKFERIFISYSLSMIPGWQKVIAQALDRLAPGGELHIVDFGRQERLPGWFKSGLRWWLGLFHVTPRDDFEAEVSGLTAQKGMMATIDRPFLGYAQHAICTRRA
jgi:S-adenosylmethionine-diacylgycerolhomoserine-N-methlytransferase